MTFSLGSTPRSLVKYNDQSISAITDIATSAKDSMVLIKTITIDDDSTISFVNGASDVVLDNTYPIYLFKFITPNPVSDATNPLFGFNGSDDTSSHAYNITKTSTFFMAYHKEDGTNQGLFYSTSADHAQATGVQRIQGGDGNVDADACGGGELWLFNPSSTTFVKHFIASFSNCDSDPSAANYKVAGYFNTTAAITAIQFTYSSGNIESGQIKLYGITDS